MYFSTYQEIHIVVGWSAGRLYGNRLGPRAFFLSVVRLHERSYMNNCITQGRTEKLAMQVLYNSHTRV
ncbi:unnamed protein product [Amoebophrya sp. A25]|nr:unnamed protein product [Amoebophrya sp. A25]CAD7946282.1 unnamed protein product [Amoebophrya sp. A25]|eukprot:GSA25T00023031001.1